MFSESERKMYADPDQAVEVRPSSPVEGATKSLHVSQMELAESLAHLAHRLDPALKNPYRENEEIDIPEALKDEVPSQSMLVRDIKTATDRNKKCLTIVNYIHNNLEI